MNQPEAITTPEIYPLDDALIALFAEFRQQAQAIEAQAQGALLLFVRQQALTGKWRLAENGRELIRTGE